jgi:hypothetical protein
MKYFTMAAPTTVAGNPPGWSVVFTRNATPAVYGAYTVTYSAAGGAPTITCSCASCQSDLMPQ